MTKQGGSISAVTTHVLDTARGLPAAGVPVRLQQARDGSVTEIAAAETDADGRARALGPELLPAGTYRLVFDTAAYLASYPRAGRLEQEAFFPEVIVTFRIDNGTSRYHVPLLLSPFGYATYRGS